MTTPATSRRLSRLLSGAGFALAMALAGPAAAEGESLADAQRIVAIGGSVHRDRLCAGRRRTACRARHHQRLSRGCDRASRCRLHARAGARGRPVGQARCDPDAGGQRPAGNPDSAQGRRRSLCHRPGGLRREGHPRQESRSSARRSASRPRPANWPSRVRAELEAATAEAEARGRNARVLFILSMNGGRILASGSGTAADGILAMAGAQNAFADFAGYKQLNDEAVISAAPDAILMISRGEGSCRPRRRRPVPSGDRADTGRRQQAPDPHGRPLPARLRTAHRSRRARPFGGARRTRPLRKERPA